MLLNGSPTIMNGTISASGGMMVEAMNSPSRSLSQQQSRTRYTRTAVTTKISGMAAIGYLSFELSISYSATGKQKRQKSHMNFIF